MGEVKKYTIFLGLLLVLALIPGAVQQAYSSLEIIPGGVVSGTVAVSSDGCGTNSPPCDILQDVIPGSTVLKALLYGTSTGFGPASIEVSLDGTDTSGILITPALFNSCKPCASFINILLFTDELYFRK